MKKCSVNPCWPAVNQLCCITETVSSFTLAEELSVFSRRDPVERWPSPVASSTKRCCFRRGRAGGGEGRGDCFPLFPSCFGSYGFVDQGRPMCVLWGLTPGHRRIIESRLTGEHGGSLRKSLDRRGNRFIDSFVFAILLHLLFYFSGN